MSNNPGQGEEATAPDGRPMLRVSTREALHRWLEQHHTRPKGVWLVTARKRSGLPRLDYPDLIEELLCFGWIDSTAGTLDHDFGMLWVSPRRQGSGWSGINKERIERLTAAGVMQPAGLAAVERGKKDGSWSLLDDIEALVVPEDLARAFAAVPGCAEKFDSLSRTNRRMVLAWISQAKRPDTRSKRISKAVDAVSHGAVASLWTPGLREPKPSPEPT